MTDQTQTQKPLSTKDRLIRSSSELFRERGYSGVGVAEILKAANAPKGSLYHHFPNGKSDLALAAAAWASDGMLRLITAAFEPATSFRDGATTFCHKLAKLIDISDIWNNCPVTRTLFDGPENTAFRTTTEHLLEGWISEVAMHAERFGSNEEEAKHLAEHFFILLQGGWELARLRRSSNVFRNLPVPG